MIRTIDKKDLEIFQKVCALNNFDINIYTIETNAKMQTVEILYKEKELTIDDAFYFGRSIQLEMSERIMNSICTKIKEL